MMSDEGQKLISKNTESNIDEFIPLLPIATKIVSKTLALDNFFGSPEKIKEIKNRILSENRDGKIESILEDKDFVEKKLEEDQEYIMSAEKVYLPYLHQWVF